MALKDLLTGLKRAFKRGSERTYNVPKRDRIGTAFGAGPAAIAAAMTGALDHDWEAFGDLVAIFDRYLLADPHLRGEYEKRLTVATKWPWTLTAAADDAQGDELAAETELAIRNLPRLRRSILRELADAIGVGFAAVELEGELRDGRIVLTAAHGIPQWSLRKVGEGWEFKDTFGAWQPVTPGKLLVYERPTKGSILTSGLMWPLLWFALFKNFSVKDWVAFLEVYGVPLRIGKYPANYDDGSPEIETLRRAVIDIASDAGAIIPSEMEIQFVESAKKETGDAFVAFVEYIDKQISKLLLGGTLTSDAGDKGARSLGEVQQDEKDDLGADDAEDLAEFLSSDLIAPLVALNHGERPGYPRWDFNTTTVAKQVKRLYVVQQAANLGLPIGEHWLRSETGIPAIAEGENPLRSGLAAAPFAAPAAATAADGSVVGAHRDAPRAVHEPPLRGVSACEATPAYLDSWALVDGLAERLAAELAPAYVEAFDAVAGNSDQTFWVDGFRAFFAERVGQGLAAAILAAIDSTIAETAPQLRGGERVDAARLIDAVIAELSGGERAQSRQGVTPLHSAAEAISAFAGLDLDAGDLARDPDGRPLWARIAPQRALDWWRRKVGVSPSQLAGLNEASRRYAFAIAGVESQRILDVARGAIGAALAEGKTQRDFAQVMRDAAKADGVEPLNPWRLKNVFDQNLSTALAAGRFSSQRSPEVKRYLPSLTFHAVGDDRTRPMHRALNGATLPVDDDFWKQYYPPIDWGCRCWVTSSRSRTRVEPAVLPPVSSEFSRGNPLNFWRETMESA